MTDNEQGASAARTAGAVRDAIKRIGEHIHGGNAHGSTADMLRKAAEIAVFDKPPNPEPCHYRERARMLDDASSKIGEVLALLTQSTAPATPPGVPDSVRALSEAATKGEMYAANGTDIRIRGVAGAPIAMTSPAGDGNGLNDRAFIVAAVNFVREQIASHPAGQSTGPGTGETIAIQKRDLVKMVDAAFAVDPSVPTEAQGDNLFAAATKLASYLPSALECEGCGSRESIEAIRARGFMSCCPERKMRPAPSSPRMGQDEAEALTSTDCVAHWEAEQKIAAGGEDLTSTECVALWKADQKLAARPAAPEAQGAEISRAARDVLAERRRQVEVERFDATFDDRYARDELPTAAAIYAAPPSADWRPWLEKRWPWATAWFKRSSRRRDLVKAGALILAEIERLDRLPAPPASSGQEGR